MNRHRLKLSPSDDIVSEWLRSFIPGHNLYFVDEHLLPRLGSLSGVLLMPREEFSQHPTYREISLANAYTYWTIDVAATHVIHAPAGWLSSLADDLRSELLVFQVVVGRGLVFQLTDDEARREWEPYVVNVAGTRHLILQQEVWAMMTDCEQRRLMLNYAEAWDSWDGHTLPSEAVSHVKRYANSFSSTPGSNCLAATLFAVTGADWILKQWVHPQAFVKTLAHASYVEVDASAMAGDVLTFWDDAGRLQHATYRLDEVLFFNKNGQTMFNPWKVIDETELFAAWGTLTRKTYRQKKQG